MTLTPSPRFRDGENKRHFAHRSGRAPSAFQLLNARRQQSFSRARCAASCARNHSFVRARRELLLSKDLRPSFLTWGVSKKRRAHFNFNAGCKQTYSQARCTASCARSHSFVRARREPLDDQVNPGHGLFRFLRPRSGSSGICLINIKIF